MRTRAFRFCILLAALFLMAAAAIAQTGDAQITGIVKDQNGSSISGASLILTNRDSGVQRTTMADAEGRYRFSAIPPGRYELKTEATGFKVESITGLVLNIGTELDRDVALSLGSVQEA